MKRTARAFTLIELMITVSIIVGVAALVAGMMSAIAGTSKSEEAVNIVNGYVQMARQQAVQYGQPVAVFFLDKTPYSLNTRMMVFEPRLTGVVTHDIVDWQTVPGSRAATLPENVIVRNASNQPCFPIIFDSQGMVHPKTLAADVSIIIGPRDANETRDRPKAIAINRATGAVMRFERAR